MSFLWGKCSINWFIAEFIKEKGQKKTMFIKSNCTCKHLLIDMHSTYCLFLKFFRHMYKVLSFFITHRGVRQEVMVEKSYTRRKPLYDYLVDIWENSPIQHSSLAQGEVLTTSGGSTPTLRHKTRATLTVFICRNK